MQTDKYVLFTENLQRLIHASGFDIGFSQLAVFMFFTVCLVGPDFGPVSLEILDSPHGEGIRQSANWNILIRLYFPKFILIHSCIRTTGAKIMTFSETQYLKNYSDFINL